MNPHDLASIEPDGTMWAATCACGEVLRRPSRGQAEAAHQHHWGLAMSRRALDKREGFGAQAGGRGPVPRLECLDGDGEFHTVAELADHTLQVHSRQPTVTERTPTS